MLGVHDGVFDIWIPLLVFFAVCTGCNGDGVHKTGVPWRESAEAHRTLYQRLVLYGLNRKTWELEYALMVLTWIAALLYQSMTDTGRVALLAIWLLRFARLAVGVG